MQVRVQHALAAALALACLLLTAAGATADGASAAGKTEGWTRVVTGGLTDPNNTYAPSYARFRDHLHLSTVASPVSEAYSGSDMVGGEIWRSAEGTAWERIGKPGLGDVRNVSFTLVTFKDRLYAVSTNTETGLEIWVSDDGVTFRSVVTGGIGDRANNAIQPAAPEVVFRDELYALLCGVGEDAALVAEGIVRAKQSARR